MGRSKEYQRLLNSKRWRELRMWKLNKNPLCELCEADGYYRSAIDIHHKVPVESATTLAEMEARCFNVNNLQSLCISCHARIHKEAGKGTLALKKERDSEALDRWKSKHEERLTNNS